MSSEPDPYEFLTFDKQDISDDVVEYTYIGVRISISDNKYKSERSVYTFFTLIGDVGGFNSAIIILPGYLMAKYSAKMYSSSI